MTYNLGDLIEATDVVAINGTNDNFTAYVDEAACANAISAIYGVGYGTYGYGQTSIALLNPSTDNTVTAQTWLNLVDAVHSLAQHVAVTVTGIPDRADLEVGDSISATGYDWSTVISAIDAARLTADPTTMTEDTVATSVRTTAWSTEIYHELEAAFGSGDTARFFFNSSGAIVLSADLVYAGADAHTLSWQALLTTMGSITMDYTSTMQSGSGGTASSIGYYDLTDVYQTVFEQSDSNPTYAANFVRVQAKRSNHSPGNTTGNNGASVVIKFEFVDAFGTPGDPVLGTITSTVGMIRPKTFEELGTGAAFPVVTASADVITLVELAGGGGITAYVFEYTVSTTVTDWDLLDQAVTDGYDPLGLSPLAATVTVSSTGVIRGSTTSNSAFTVPVLPVADSRVTLILENGAVIAGQGGQGGQGAPSGVCGCLTGGNGTSGGTAITLASATRIINYGIIGGGGGGGGGGGAECSYIWNSSAGGGGGGAGQGSGGPSNDCGVTAGRLGQPGSSGELILGGAGGTPGNIYTASGGTGGGLGQPGSAGTTIDSLGGTGGSAGTALQGAVFVVPGSVLGDIRGPIV
jgi:hypothetical protein